MSRCKLTGSPVVLMPICPEHRWPEEAPSAPERIKLLWLSGDMSQGGCTRYMRDVLHILKHSPVDVEVVWFQDHHFDSFIESELSSLASVSRYNSATFYQKVAAADLITSMNMNLYVQDHDLVIPSLAGKLFCQLHGTCDYTKSIIEKHSPYTRYYMSCSKRAATLLTDDDVVMVSPVPVDFNRVTRQKTKAAAKLSFCNIPPEVQVVTYAGRLSHEKGIPRIVETIKALPNNIKLLVVGNGHYEDVLLPILRTLGDRLIYKPWVKYPTDYLDATDVFLVQSDYEGVPLSLVEALCHGTTVVSVDVGVAFDYLIKTPGKRPFNAVYAFEGPHTVLDALGCDDVEQSAAITAVMHLEHNHGRIRDQWMEWLTRLKEIYASQSQQPVHIPSQS